MNNKNRSELFFYASFILRGRLLAYAIGLLLTPFIMRFFSPEAYGSVAIVIMAGTILASTSTLALEKASLIENDNYKSDLLRQLAAIIALFFIAIVAIVSFIQFILFNNFIGINESFYHLLIAVLLEAIACVAIAARISHNQIQRVASADVWQMLVTSFGRIISGFHGFTDALTLFVWYAIGMLFKVIYLRDHVYAKTSSMAHMWRIRKTLKALLQSYSDFPKYNVPTGLMNQLGTYLPLLTFGACFGPVIAGYYAVARRFIKAPGNILTNTIRPIVIRQLSGLISDEIAFNNFIIRISCISLFVGLLTLGIFIFLNNFILIQFLRKDWAEVVLLLNFLSPLVVVPFINLPVGAAVVACRCQKPNLFIQSMIAIFRNIVLIGSSLFGLSWQNSALIFSTCSLFFTIFGSFWVYRLYIFKKAVVA